MASTKNTNVLLQQKISFCITRESEYLAKLVTKTLLYIDFRNLVARYIDVTNMSG